MFSSLLVFSMTSFSLHKLFWGVVLIYFWFSRLFFLHHTSFKIHKHVIVASYYFLRFNIKLFYLFSIFSKTSLVLLPFFDNKSNGNLQTTIRYMRWSVLWFLYSRLNISSVTDKITTRAANLARYVPYDVKVCQFSWIINSSWHCERVVIISNFLSRY